MSKNGTPERDESAATNVGLFGLPCLFFGTLALSTAYFGLAGFGWSLTAWGVIALALSFAFFNDAEKKRKTSSKDPAQ
jgi:hypothetical protein